MRRTRKKFKHLTSYTDCSMSRACKIIQNIQHLIFIAHAKIANYIVFNISMFY